MVSTCGDGIYRWSRKGILCGGGREGGDCKLSKLMKYSSAVFHVYEISPVTDR